MCNDFQIILIFTRILLLNVVPVIGSCYYEYQSDYYNCNIDVGVIVGVVLGVLFGLLIICFIVIIICCQVKTQGIRGHPVQPSTVLSENTTHEKVFNNRHSTPNGNVYPPPTQYSPPPAYPGEMELRPT